MNKSTLDRDLNAALNLTVTQVDPKKATPKDAKAQKAKAGTV